MKLFIIALACLIAAQVAFALPAAHPNSKHQGLSMAPGKFDRVFIMTFENHGFNRVKDDPNFKKYAQMGTLMTNYYAVAHPSQPNYWCHIAGDHFWKFDDAMHDMNATTVVDLLEARKVSWKGYMEELPYECFTGERWGQYYRKHNPFISFDNIRTNPRRCAQIVNARQLDIDLANGNLPQFSYYTPNNENNGHDTDLAYAGKYLDSFLGPRLAKFPPRTLIIVTWDEDDFLGTNHIHTFAIGSMLTPGTTDNNRYNHYSFLRTVEDNWNLGTLGRNDKTANAYQFLP